MEEGSSQGADGWQSSLAKDTVYEKVFGCQTNIKSPFFWGQETGGLQSWVQEGMATVGGQDLPKQQAESRAP